MSRASELERQMLDLINAERTSRDLNPVTLELRLNESSELHSQWMLEEDRFSHRGENGSSAGDRMRDADFAFEGGWSWGENIAYQSERGEPGYADDVIDLHNSLMNSPGHRANILDPDYEAIGLGIEIGEFNGFEVVMVTQNFADTAAELLIDEANAPDNVPEAPAEVPVAEGPDIAPEDPAQEAPEDDTPAPEPEAETPVQETPDQEPEPDVPVAEAPEPAPEDPVTETPEPEPETPVTDAPVPEPEIPVADMPTAEPEKPVAEAPEPESPAEPAPDDPIAEAPAPETPANVPFQFFFAGFFQGFTEDDFIFETEGFILNREGPDLNIAFDF